MSNKLRIVFLCHFSNPIIRQRLDLKNFFARNIICKFCVAPLYRYDDFAIWVSDYIQEFEKYNEFEFHIIAPHKGMRKLFQSFDVNGIHYHFFKCDSNYITDLCNVHLHLEEKNNYRRNRKRISTIINDITPDLVLLCGAENPYYSAGVLDVINIPTYVILQTLLNDPKRIEMGVGTPYRRKIEMEILQHANYICVNGDEAISKVKGLYNKAKILPVAFPTHRPSVTISERKDYDFVYFSRAIMKCKGIEDVLRAMSLVVKANKGAKLNVIGECDNVYKKQLNSLITDLDINSNVFFSGYYEDIRDTYSNVTKAKAVVVPGITAGLNSTVRESMFLGLPTICYETNATSIINKNKRCLYTAPMEDYEELANQMLSAISNPEKALVIANNGKEYAEKEFGNEQIVKQLIDYCKQIIDRQV